jgi:hypothetical protein
MEHSQHSAHGEPGVVQRRKRELRSLTRIPILRSPHPSELVLLLDLTCAWWSWFPFWSTSCLKWLLLLPFFFRSVLVLHSLLGFTICMLCIKLFGTSCSRAEWRVKTVAPEDRKQSGRCPCWSLRFTNHWRNARWSPGFRISESGAAESA